MCVCARLTATGNNFAHVVNFTVRWEGLFFIVSSAHRRGGGRELAVIPWPCACSTILTAGRHESAVLKGLHPCKSLGDSTLIMSNDKLLTRRGTPARTSAVLFTALFFPKRFSDPRFSVLPLSKEISRWFDGKIAARDCAGGIWNNKFVTSWGVGRQTIVRLTHTHTHTHVALIAPEGSLLIVVKSFVVYLGKQWQSGDFPCNLSFSEYLQKWSPLVCT